MAALEPNTVAHKTPPDNFTRENLASDGDNPVSEQLFSSAAGAETGIVDAEFDYMEFTSEQTLFMDDLPDLDVPIYAAGTHLHAGSGPYEAPNSQVFDRVHRGTCLAEEDATASLTQVFSKLPYLVSDALPKPKPIYLDLRIRNEILTDFARRMSDQRHDLEEGIPDCPTLNRFLTRFFESFNTHLPIFHIPTFDIAHIPSPLLLVMCSIGAMYQLESKRAHRLRRLASESLDASDLRRQTALPRSERPVWMIQCKLLILYGATLGGDASAASSALEEVGYLHKEFTLRRARLSAACMKREAFSLNWPEWIERESSKRLLFGIYILSSLLTITYNVSPGLSTSCDLDLELPEEERLWTAPTYDSWKDALNLVSSVKRFSASRVLTQLMFGKSIETTTEVRIGLYAAIVLVHAVNIQTWHISQSTNYFTTFLVDQELEAQVARRCLKKVEVALDRCTQVFAGTRRIEDGPPHSSESPLPFNGLNLLRSCYARVFCADSGGFCRSILLSEDDVEISQAVKSFVRYTDFNAPLLAKIVAFMLEVFQMPSHLGRMVIRKTAALTWSVETVITLWDCGMMSSP